MNIANKRFDARKSGAPLKLVSVVERAGLLEHIEIDSAGTHACHVS